MPSQPLYLNESDWKSGIFSQPLYLNESDWKSGIFALEVLQFIMLFNKGSFLFVFELFQKYSASKDYFGP